MNSNPSLTEEIEKQQKTQRKLILNVIIWITLIAAIVLGFLNITFNTWTSVIALFGLALFCSLLLIFNSKGYQSLTSFLFMLLLFIVIMISMFDGDGILDSGILAIPLFILFGALLLGNRYLFIFLTASFIALFLLVLFESKGYIVPTIHAAKYSDLIPIIILVSVTSLVVWVIVNNYEMSNMSI